MGSMDAFQAMLAQLQQGDQTLGPAAGADLSQLLGQLHSPPGLNQLPPGLNPAASSACDLLQAASSSSPLQFDATTDAWVHAANTHSGSSSPTTSLPKDQHNLNGPRVFVPDSLKAATGSSPPTDAQLLLQAAMAQQQPALGHAADAANLLPLLQEQLLLQALQQQQQTAAAAAQSNMQAALAAALSTGPGVPPGLGHGPLGGAFAAALANNSNAGNFWPYASPNLADPTSATAAAATAAALLMAQQQQQQAAVNQALASAGLLGPSADPNAFLQQLLLSQHQGLAGAAANSAVNQLQPWALKALTAQMQQQGAAVNLAAFQQQQMALAGLLNTAPVPGYSNNPLPRTTSNTSTQSRRRSCRRSSGTANPDLASSFAGFSAASRANSTAGSDVGAAASSGLPAVLPAGISAKDLCPTKYADTWGADDSAEAAAAPAAAANVAATATSVSSDGSCKLARGSSSASTSSLDSVADAAASVCGSARSLSSASRQGSGASANSADDKWQWDSHFGSLDDEAASQGSSGLEGRACRKAAEAAAAAKAAAKQQQADDTAAGKDQGDSKSQKDSKKPAAAVEGVWFPGAREVAGDDSWYLPRPPTCRLFVGNIGCWVDEAMLLAYFGKYGHVVDVQVRNYGWVVCWGCVPGLQSVLWSCMLAVMSCAKPYHCSSSTNQSILQVLLKNEGSCHCCSYLLCIAHDDSNPYLGPASHAD